ncbi:MAG: NAD-dependent epimerase/dehydratase family protein, partial [Verrucomicrobia bacterium]|nr:NAD-dependent epimerase/dehydratase family protein [Verrucomicrobiota bacterium]
DSSRVVPLWIRGALHNEPLVVYGPEKKLDFTYLDDAVDGIRRALERFDAARGKPINISSGTSVEIVSVARMLRELTGSASEIMIKPTRAGEVWTYQADLSRAKQLLNYVPTIDVECGLQRSVDWYKTHLPTHDDD